MEFLCLVECWCPSDLFGLVGLVDLRGDLSVDLSVDLSESLFTFPSEHLSVDLSEYLFVFLSSICLSV